MSLETVLRHITDVLWAVGGIGAAAELGLDGGDHNGRGPDSGAPCSAPASGETIPKEGEPCRSSCPSCSSRPLSR